MAAPGVDNAGGGKRRSRRGVLLALGLLVVLPVPAYALWRSKLRDVFFPRNFDVVIPGVLYRSGRMSTLTAERTLRENHIAVAISLIDDSDEPDLAKPMVEAFTAVGLERVRLSMDGNGTSTAARYAVAVDAIVAARRAGKPVLVHCNAGAQRTGGVIATYKLLVLGEDPRVVKADLLRHGHDPHSNPKLIPWLNANLPAIAADLKARGDIPAVPDPIPTLTPGKGTE